MHYITSGNCPDFYSKWQYYSSTVLSIVHSREVLEYLLDFPNFIVMFELSQHYLFQFLDKSEMKPERNVCLERTVIRK